MRQYCPVCKQLYESDTRFCPECDVVMYKESVYLNCLKNNAKIKIIPHKKVDAMMPLGIILTVVGVIAIFLCAVVASSTDGIICALSGMSVNIGVVTAVVGICYISNNLGYTKKVPSSNGSFYIKCPYCNSDDVEKITSMSRAGSFAVSGMGSGKIGKQWHCNNCKSDF